MSLKEFPSLGNQVRSRGGEGPRRRAWQPTPGFLPGEFHGQRGLAGYSPWGLKVSGTPERLPLSLSSLGTGVCSSLSFVTEIFHSAGMGQTSYTDGLMAASHVETICLSIVIFYSILS